MRAVAGAYNPRAPVDATLPSWSDEGYQLTIGIEASRAERARRVPLEWFCQIVQSVAELDLRTYVSRRAKLLNLLPEFQVLLPNRCHVRFELSRVEGEIRESVKQLRVVHSLCYVAYLLETRNQPIKHFKHAPNSVSPSGQCTTDVHSFCTMVTVELGIVTRFVRPEVAYHFVCKAVGRHGEGRILPRKWAKQRRIRP